MLFQISHESLKILDRHPSLCSARCQSRQISRVQSKLFNPCLHSGRKITRPSRPSWHWQPLNRWRYPMAISILPHHRPLFPVPYLYPLLFFWGLNLAFNFLLLFSCHLDIPQDRTHRITFSLRSFPLLPYPSITRCDAHHRFTRLHLGHLLIHLNFIPGLHLQAQ